MRGEGDVCLDGSRLARTGSPVTQREKCYDYDCLMSEIKWNDNTTRLRAADER